MCGWDFYWTPENRTFIFNNRSMISTTWLLENPEGDDLPPGLPEHPNGEWFESVGAQRVSNSPFMVPSPSPTPFEIIDSRNDARGNLYWLDLNR